MRRVIDTLAVFLIAALFGIWVMEMVKNVL
jgi:hypothetical protein